jgi:2-aminoadipate transaminase
MPRSAAAGRVRASVVRDVLALAGQADVISLAGGLPAPEAFPSAEVAEAIGRVLAADGGSALQYSATEGHLPLRGWIAAHHGVEIDHVLVTSGSQQGLDLLARAMVDPGEVVALADPGYVGAIQALQLVGARLVGVGSDQDGLLVDDLAGRLVRGLRPTLVYVVPNFHNPTGASLAPERCRALADLADHYGFVIVVDDPYRELRWAGAAPPPLATLSDRVVTLGSFSKTLCPGLRVGYVVAAPDTIRAAVLVKQAADLHTATLNQRATYDMITKPGFMDSHLGRLRSLYQNKATALSAALRCRLGALVDFAEPQGGMFVWARLADGGADAEALLVSAIAQGVAFVPGAAFAVASSFPHHLRLCFATATTEQLDVAVQRLGHVLAAPTSGGPAGSRVHDVRP